MANLMRPHVPFIEQFGEEHAVTKKVPCDTELLLLLARSAPNGLNRTELGQSSKYPPSTVTGVLKRLDDARYIHRTRDGRHHVTGPGEEQLARSLNPVVG
jgi:DNA-binding transcriptional ArsR family regulator